jgi:hypothetical protein
MPTTCVQCFKTLLEFGSGWKQWCNFKKLNTGWNWQNWTWDSRTIWGGLIHNVNFLKKLEQLCWVFIHCPTFLGEVGPISSHFQAQPLSIFCKNTWEPILQDFSIHHPTFAKKCVFLFKVSTCPNFHNTFSKFHPFVQFL